MMRFGLVFLALLAACAAAPPAPMPAASPPAEGAPEARPFPSTPRLSDVLARLSGTPSLLASREAIAAAEGNLVQADLAPNPILTLRGELIDPGEMSRGVQKRMISASERIETAGKREARVSLSGDLVDEAGVARRVELYRAARVAASAYQDAVTSQLLVARKRDAATAVASLLEVEEAKLAAGRVTEGTVLPLRIRAAELGAAVAEEEARLRTALRGLEGVLALGPGAIGEVFAEFVDDRALPSPVGAGGVEKLLYDNPEVELRRAQVGSAGGRVGVEETLAVPDVTVGLGFEDGPEPGAGRRRTFGLFVEAPLPVIDRNQGSIRAARAEVRRAEEILRDAESRVRSEFVAACETAAALRRSLSAYEDGVIPARERDLALAQSAERAGRADRTPVLGAELTLLEARIRAAELRGAIARKAVDAWALLGRPLAEWPTDFRLRIPGVYPDRGSIGQ